jgi:hypothetical protein
MEVCTGGSDEDCDGKVDCHDEECSGIPECIRKNIDQFEAQVPPTVVANFANAPYAESILEGETFTLPINCEAKRAEQRMAGAFELASQRVQASVLDTIRNRQQAQSPGSVSIPDLQTALMQDLTLKLPDATQLAREALIDIEANQQQLTQLVMAETSSAVFSSIQNATLGATSTLQQELVGIASPEVERTINAAQLSISDAARTLREESRRRVERARAAIGAAGSTGQQSDGVEAEAAMQRIRHAQSEISAAIFFF